MITKPSTDSAKVGANWVGALKLLGFSLVFILTTAGWTWYDVAVKHLNEARATSVEAEKLSKLTTALDALQRTGDGRLRKENKPPAVALVQSAISEVQNHDINKANDDIDEALGLVRGDSKGPSPNHEAASIVHLTEDQTRAVVLVKGDNAEGTGFLIKTADGPAVVTNIHVISNNPNVKITTNTGATITTLSLKGATDRDLAMFAIKDENYNYLDWAADVGAVAHSGDEVVTPGNSEGGEVVLNTGGKLLGVGPDRIEFDNPIYHGNSGGPVFHTKSGKVIGLVTEAVKVDTSDELDKASFASRNSAITGSMRYFGFRIDNVPQWETYDWRRFQIETLFLDQFEERNRRLDCYLNAPNDNKPEDNTWREDPKIMKARDNLIDLGAGADAAQRLEAFRALHSELADIANLDLEAIQNPANFYSFDQRRAKDALAYRKALIKELENISDDDSRLANRAIRSD